MDTLFPIQIWGNYVFADVMFVGSWWNVEFVDVLAAERRTSVWFIQSLLSNPLPFTHAHDRVIQRIRYRCGETTNKAKNAAKQQNTKQCSFSKTNSKNKQQQKHKLKDKYYGICIPFKYWLFSIWFSTCPPHGQWVWPMTSHPRVLRRTCDIRYVPDLKMISN